MRYGILTADNEQTTLFTEKHTTQRKQASVPIYRAVLVKGENFLPMNLGYGVLPMLLLCSRSSWRG
jgi:hypothetical protein